LKEIELKNKAGTYQSSLEAGPTGIGMAADEAIAAGVMPMSPLSDFSKVSLHNQAGKGTWPIVAISYVYVRQDLSKLGEKACLLKAFLEYIISSEGQGLLPTYGAVGIPAKVKGIAQSAIDLLTMPACKAWTFETETLKGSGQADYIISAKRRSFYEYNDGTMASDVAALTGGTGQISAGSASTEIAALKTEIAALKAQVSKNDDDTDVMGIVSLIVACVAIAISLCVSCLTLKPGNSAAYAKEKEGTTIGNVM